MDIKTKHRVIGIVVLIALAIIFLPLLFTHSETEPSMRLSSRVPATPDKPNFQLAVPTIPPADANPDANAAATVSTNDNSLATAPLAETTDTAESDAATQDTQVADASSPDAANTATTTTAKPLLPTATPSATPASDSSTAPKLKEQRTKSGAVKTKLVNADQTTKNNQTVAPANAAQAWTIQVGSFGDKANAAALVGKLQAQGFPAYTNEVKTGATSMSRVFVGPELQRNNAEAILTKLQQQLGLKGVIVKYQV